MLTEDYERLKEFYIEVEDSLTLADYEYLLEENDYHICYKKPNEWRIKTACHNIDINTAKPNLRFNVESRVFTCFSECSCSYNIYTLLQKRFNLIGNSKTSLEVLKYVCEYKGIPFNFKAKEVAPNNKSNWKKILTKYSKNTNIIEKVTFDKSILNQFPKIYHTDWLDYGISEEVLEKYNIRYYPYRSQIVIPCNDVEGDLIGVRIRNMNTDNEIKYKPLKILDGTEYNFPTDNYFYGENFNIERIKKQKEVWLVEAEKSVLKAETWFGDKNITLGLYGHNLSDVKLKKLINANVSRAVIMLDSDFTEIGDNKEYDAFEKQVIKMANKLKPYMEVYICYNNLGYTGYKFSPFDFTREQFDKLYESKELYS